MKRKVWCVGIVKLINVKSVSTVDEQATRAGLIGGFGALISKIMAGFFGFS